MIAKHHWCRVTSNKSPVVVRFTDSVDRSNFRETNTREDWAQVKAELLCAKCKVQINFVSSQKSAAKRVNEKNVIIDDQT